MGTYFCPNAIILESESLGVICPQLTFFPDRKFSLSTHTINYAAFGQGGERSPYFHWTRHLCQAPKCLTLQCQGWADHPGLDQTVDCFLFASPFACFGRWHLSNWKQHIIILILKVVDGGVPPREEPAAAISLRIGVSMEGQKCWNLKCKETD